MRGAPRHAYLSIKLPALDYSADLLEEVARKAAETGCRLHFDALGPDSRHTVRLTVTTRDGREFQREARHSRGGAADPLPPAQILQKFRSQAGRTLERDTVHQLEHTLLHLGDGEGGVASLSGLLRVKRRTT